MNRKVETGTLLPLLLVAMFTMVLRIEPIKAARVTGAQVFAYDLNHDGWIRADGYDEIFVSWDDMGDAVVHFELYKDFAWEHSLSGIGLTNVRYVPDQVAQYFGTCNTIRIWATSPSCGFTEIFFCLPKPTDDFPVYPGSHGYVILVSGDRDDHALKFKINLATDQIFDDLLSVGFSDSRIYYLNKDFNWRVDAVASSTNIETAITYWAASRAGPSEPLFLVMFDHGFTDSFAVSNDDDLYDRVEATELAAWLNDLETATHADIHVVISACYSGSFVDHLSKSGRVIMTCCSSEESGSFGRNPPYYCWFFQDFWPEIKQHHSLLDAFNQACEMALQGPLLQHALLDDNGDGVGHGWDTPSGSEDLPHDGDGNLASSVYIGGSSWIFPWIRQVIDKQYYAWPPNSSITLWARVENNTPLSQVTAWMLPPDWTPPVPNGTLIAVPFEPFEMTDADHDGNWTVDIPAINFTRHAIEPANFKFMITAEEVNGSTAIPLITAVEFTDDGFPLADLGRPWLRVERPIRRDLVHSLVTVNGTATDDVCLQKVELFINGNLTQIINLEPSSNSFFEFNFDTSSVPSGPITILVKAHDTSNNTGTESVEINVNTDIAVTNVITPKNVTGQGLPLAMYATVSNQGERSETFEAIAYANTTIIGKKIVTLANGNATNFELACNTTGLDKGNYTMRVATKFLLHETDVADNTLSDGWIIVAMVGDVTGLNGYPDGKVNMEDVGNVARLFGINYPDTRYNRNFDINDDTRINMEDVGTVARHFGEIDP